MKLKDLKTSAQTSEQKLRSVRPGLGPRERRLLRCEPLVVKYSLIKSSYAKEKITFKKARAEKIKLDKEYKFLANMLCYYGQWAGLLPTLKYLETVKYAFESAKQLASDDIGEYRGTGYHTREAKYMHSILSHPDLDSEIAVPCALLYREVRNSDFGSKYRWEGKKESNYARSEEFIKEVFGEDGKIVSYLLKIARLYENYSAGGAEKVTYETLEGRST